MLRSCEWISSRTRLWAVRAGETHCVGGVRRGGQGMGTHVRDHRGLSCRSRCSGRCRSNRVACGRAASEPAPDLFRDVKLATAEGPCSDDGVARAGIAWSLHLEQCEHSLCTVSRPHSHDPSLRFAQRLR